MRFVERKRNAVLSYAFCLFIHSISLCSVKATSCESAEEEHDHCVRNDVMEHSNSKAVVLYNEDTVLPLHRQSRSFEYASHQIVVKQEWKKLGVAAVVWDAAEVLASYLEQNPVIVKDKKIIELGAGSGLVGIVAALLGGHTTITDRDEVFTYLQTTVHENLPDHIFQGTKVMPLDWTKNLDNFDDSYDVILGADIVYIEEVFEELLRTLGRLSRAEKTVIYLSCRIRYNRDTMFLDRLAEDFLVEKVLYNQEKDVNLYKVTKL